MQRLTYVNTLGEELRMSDDSAFILAHIEGTGAVERKISSIDAVDVAGSYITGARRVSREVRATISLQGKSRKDLYRLRTELCALLSLDKVFNEDADGNNVLGSKIIYENDYGKWQTLAMIEDDVDFTKRIKDWQKDVKLVFACPDSYWYALGEQSVRIEFSDSAFTLPFDFPISFGTREFEAVANNDGAIKTSAIIEIYGQGETPELINQRSGKRIKLTEPVPVGSVLTINTDERELSARIRNAKGVEQSAFGMLDPQHPISQWQLLPGENIIVYEPGAEAALTKIVVRWRSRYEGV